MSEAAAHEVRRTTFVAVPLEGAALAAAGAVLEAARARVPDVRWVRPEGLHVTLHFFGPLPAAEHRPVLDALAPAAAATAPFAMRLDHLGRFPPRGPARVLWAGVGEGAEPLARLAAGCGVVLAAAGYPVDDRPYRAHCTLGRPRAWTPAHGEAWDTLDLPRQPAQTSARVVLLESHPSPGGSRYEPCGELPFTG